MIGAGNEREGERMMMVERESFTLGSPEMVEAMCDRITVGGEKYEMALTPPDMCALIRCLAVSVGFISPDDIPEGDTDAAMSLFSGIGETLDVEGI